MIAIRGEIDKVGSGEYDATDNPLKNAPHTAQMLIVGEWKHPYPPAAGAYPGYTAHPAAGSPGAGNQQPRVAGEPAPGGPGQVAGRHPDLAALDG